MKNKDQFTNANLRTDHAQILKRLEAIEANQQTILLEFNAHKTEVQLAQIKRLRAEVEEAQLEMRMVLGNRESKLQKDNEEMLEVLKKFQAILEEKVNDKSH